MQNSWTGGSKSTTGPEFAYFAWRIMKGIIFVKEEK